jgi:predicted RecA/RadA family phage recombinase
VKNFVQPGNVITVIAPAGGVTSGAVVILGALVGVAATTQAAGAEVEISVEGVFDLPKTPADALVQGAVAKVTPATGIVGAAGTAAIGWVVQAAPSGSNTARVRLCPSIAGTPTVFEESPTEKLPPDRPERHAEPVGAGRRGRE